MNFRPPRPMSSAPEPGLPPGLVDECNDILDRIGAVAGLLGLVRDERALEFLAEGAVRHAAALIEDEARRLRDMLNERSA